MKIIPLEVTNPKKLQDMRAAMFDISPEAVYRMGRKRERTIIHLFGTREQKTEDLEYFRLFADENGIAFRSKGDKVFLGVIE